MSLKIRYVVRALVIFLVIFGAHRFLAGVLSQQQAMANESAPKPPREAIVIDRLSCQRLDDDPATPLMIELWPRATGPVQQPIASRVRIDFYDDIGVMSNYALEEERTLSDGPQVFRHAVPLQTERCVFSYTNGDGAPLAYPGPREVPVTGK